MMMMVGGEGGLHSRVRGKSSMLATGMRVCSLKLRVICCYLLCVLVFMTSPAPPPRTEKIHPGTMFRTADRGRGLREGGAGPASRRRGREGRRGGGGGREGWSRAAHRLMVINTQLQPITEESSLSEPRPPSTTEHIFPQSWKQMLTASGSVSTSFWKTVRLYSNSRNISLQPPSHPDALDPCGESRRRRRRCRCCRCCRRSAGSLPLRPLLLLLPPLPLAVTSQG